MTTDFASARMSPLSFDNFLHEIMFTFSCLILHVCHSFLFVHYALLPFGLMSIKKKTLYVHPIAVSII